MDSWAQRFQGWQAHFVSNMCYTIGVASTLGVFGFGIALWLWCSSYRRARKNLGDYTDKPALYIRFHSHVVGSAGGTQEFTAFLMRRVCSRIPLRSIRATELDSRLRVNDEKRREHQHRSPDGGALAPESGIAIVIPGFTRGILPRALRAIAARCSRIFSRPGLADY